MDYLVDIQDLYIRDQSGKLLSSANLQIASGRTLAIFGPGGSGKSLLLNFIFGVRDQYLSYEFNGYHQKKGLTQCLSKVRKKSCEDSLANSSYDLYLIDEPEMNCAPDSFKSTKDQITQKGGTLVFVTHHLGFLEDYADDVFVIKYGEQLGVYTKESFFQNEDPYIDYLSKMGC